MNTMKKIISVLLVPVLLLCMLSIPCAAADEESGVVRAEGWYVGGDEWSVLKLVLDPKYVQCADDVVILNGRQDVFCNITVRRETTAEYGECFAVTFITEHQPIDEAYICADMFFDAQGQGNEPIRFADVVSFGKLPLIDAEEEFSTTSVNTIPQHRSIDVTFALEGSVTLNGKTLAENVLTFSIPFDETGSYTLDLSVDGLFTRTYQFDVKTTKQIYKERVAELRKRLGKDTIGFFLSIPIALVTTLMALSPLGIAMLAWPFWLTLPFQPFRIAEDWFDTLRELIRVRVTRVVPI